MARYGVSLSSGGKLYARRVVTDGKVQKAFAEQIGRPVGACVASKVKTGMGQTEIRKAVKDCSKSARGKKLSF